jgi:hypothetical protein
MIGRLVRYLFSSAKALSASRVHSNFPVRFMSLKKGRAFSPTSREKAIPSAPKWLIPGAFWFASDLHAGGNAYRW